MQGLTLAQIGKLAYKFAEKLQIPHRFNHTNKSAGYDWTAHFMARHNLSVRKPEPTSVARANGFNQKAVYEFFDLLESVIKEKISNQKIFGMSTRQVSVSIQNPTQKL